MSEYVADIEGVVRVVPGVAGLYRTGSTMTKLVGEAAERLGVSEGAASRVIVTEHADRTEVEIAIGIEADATAAETAQAVREEVEELLTARAAPAPFVRITVVHVSDAAQEG